MIATCLHANNCQHPWLKRQSFRQMLEDHVLMRGVSTLPYFFMSDFPDFSQLGYQVIQELGHNYTGGRVTYLATDTQTQQAVVIKQFQFAKFSSAWSGFKAYEREIEVLQRID